MRLSAKLLDRPSRGIRSSGMRRTIVLFGMLVTAATAGLRSRQRDAWMFGPFVKSDVNPVLAPDRGAVFRSPPNDSVVHWEEYATFNPAAVVRDGHVHLLFRAEDASGDATIGHH